MKDHVIVKVVKSFLAEMPQRIPYWKDFINDKTLVVDSLHPDFDKLFKDNNLSFWVTQEYPMHSHEWNRDEINAGLDRMFRIIIQQDTDLPDVIVDRIRLIPWVESAYGIEVGASELPPTILATQTSVFTQRPADLIYASYAKSFTQGLPEIKVAVIDTGVNLSHPELQGKLGKGSDFVNLEGLDTSDFIGDFLDYDDVPEDEVGHGTHVSGIIAAKGLNMDEGICPHCTIMPVRVLATLQKDGRRMGAGIIPNISVGIKWAVDHGATVCNMSLGVKSEGGGLPHKEVIEYALSKDVTIIAASGNDGTSERYYPGALPGVIAVGASDSSGAVTNFTSYGANISVVAPGVNIYSSFANNTYAVASGTSQASPFVCGAVALMKSLALAQGKKLGNEEIRYILKNTSDKVDTQLRNEHAGYGILNLADAFKLLNHLFT